MANKKIVTLLIAGLLTVAQGVAVSATEQGYVSVSSSMSKEVEPNKAEVTFSIETIEKTAQEASEKNKKITNAVIAAIKPELSTSTMDNVRTSAFVVSPDYTWTKDNKKILNGYVATNSIYFTTSNIQNVGKVIDLALSNGANKVNRFNLTLDNPNKYCTSVLEDAVKDTQFKASSIAKVLNTSVTGVRSVSTSCSSQSSSISPYSNMMLKASSSDSAASSTPIEAGKIKVYASVDASYYVK